VLYEVDAARGDRVLGAATVIRAVRGGVASSR
jgi:hypothetical protein